MSYQPPSAPAVNAVRIADTNTIKIMKCQRGLFLASDNNQLNDVMSMIEASESNFYMQLPDSVEIREDGLTSWAPFRTRKTSRSELFGYTIDEEFWPADKYWDNVALVNKNGVDSACDDDDDDGDSGMFAECFRLREDAGLNIYQLRDKIKNAKREYRTIEEIKPVFIKIVATVDVNTGSRFIVPPMHLLTDDVPSIDGALYKVMYLDAVVFYANEIIDWFNKTYSTNIKHINALRSSRISSLTISGINGYPFYLDDSMNQMFVDNLDKAKALLERAKKSADTVKLILLESIGKTPVTKETQAKWYTELASIHARLKTIQPHARHSSEFTNALRKITDLMKQVAANVE